MEVGLILPAAGAHHSDRVVGSTANREQEVIVALRSSTARQWEGHDLFVSMPQYDCR